MFISKFFGRGWLLDQAQKNKSGNMPDKASEIQTSEIKKTILGSVVTFEGTYQGKPIRVRILGDPSQEPGP